MKKSIVFILLLRFLQGYTQIIINHDCINLFDIPVNWIDSAKANLRITYGHTSHGSQLISGMDGIIDKYGDFYNFNNGGSDGSLDLHDYAMSGDLGHTGDTLWAENTRIYLANPSNSDCNVVIWSWCGGVSDNTEEGINIYLNKMSELEIDYPYVKFIYMTGHLDGTGETGNLHHNNEIIRNYCINNNKVLYDFADIESYDPYGNYYLDKAADDECYYDSDYNGSLDSSWAINYCTDNPDSCFYSGYCAHSHSLNCQLKGICAWWLWSRLAGWDGESNNVYVTSISIYGENSDTIISAPGESLQMNATVLPDNATDKSVSWSVSNENIASINSSGLLTAISYGTVNVTATANDGSGISGNTDIGVFEACNINTYPFFQEWGKKDLTNYLIIYPNPSNGKFNVSFYNNNRYTDIQIRNVFSQSIYHCKIDTIDEYVDMDINLSTFPDGIYIIYCSNNKDSSSQVLIIQ